MAQSNIEFIKKVKFQKHKTDAASVTLNDEQKVEFTQKILNAAIDSGDTIVDAEMPSSMFNITIDWNEGTLNDSVVSILSGDYGIIQNLFENNSTIIDVTATQDAALAAIQAINNKTVVEDVNYTFVNGLDELNDALNLANEIIG